MPAVVVTRPGWEVDNPQNSSDILKATLPTRLLPDPTAGYSGGASSVIVKSNISNGNYDVYKPSLTGDKLIYSRNASDNKLTIHDQSLYNQYFNANNNDGKKSFDTLDKSVRLATFDNAQLNTGTDPVRNQNFSDIKNTPTYKSIANSAKPGERAPGATPSTNPDNPQQSEESSQPAEDTLNQLNADQEKYLKNNSAAKKGTREEYESVVYPSGLDSAYQDCIKFTILKYQQSGLVGFGESDAGSRLVEVVKGRPELSQGKTRTPKATIVLPMPGSIQDSNTVNWSGGNLDPVSQALGSVAQTALEGGNAGQEVQSQAQKALQDTNSLRQGIISWATQSAISGNNVMQRQYGAIINPNLELLFNNPELRTFSFSFKLSPRSADEAVRVKKIIRNFKQAMSVKRSSTSFLLQSPNTFAISYIFQDKSHPYLNRFKECALTSCNVNYTPEGNYMAFDDSNEPSMVSYQLDLTFQELEPVYDDEYGDGYSNIGF